MAEVCDPIQDTEEGGGGSLFLLSSKQRKRERKSLVVHLKPDQQDVLVNVYQGQICGLKNNLKQKTSERLIL